MACEQWRSQLDAYLDGELPSEALRSFDAHLRSCQSCAADALAGVQFKRSIKNAGMRFTPSADLRNKVQKRIGARPRPGWIVGWKLATAALGLLLIGSAAASYVSRENLRQQHFYSELADLHVATLASPNPVDVVSSDRHTVKPWFQGKVPFTFNLPELQNSDVTLLGGRVAYLGQTSGAHLIFQIRKHEISVFIFPESATNWSPGSDSKVERRQTFNVEQWNQGGLHYIVFGDVGAEDIQRLSSLLRAVEGS